LNTINYIAIACIALALSACQTMGPSIKLSTESGYSTEALSYLPDKKQPSKDVVIIALHGKGSRPDKGFRVELYEKLNAAGYEVVAPFMTWSERWDGTFDEGLAVIDAAVEKSKSRGKEAVVVGHSLGGASSLIYASNPHKDLLGIAVIAPGHPLHRSGKMRKIVKSSVKKARKMVKKDRGDEKSYFKERNSGRTRDVYMSAEAYLSFYDKKVHPNVDELLGDITIPLLWIGGREDPLTSKLQMAERFEEIPKNNKSRFVILAGDHQPVVPNSADEIIKWIESLN